MGDAFAKAADGADAVTVMCTNVDGVAGELVYLVGVDQAVLIATFVFEPEGGGTKIGVEIEGPLDELKKAIEANDIPGMRTATDKVAQASQTLGAAMYTMAQEAGGSEATADAAADTSEDDVVELRRCLYGLYAVLRLHNAQEDESAFSLLPDPSRR